MNIFTVTFPINSRVKRKYTYKFAYECQTRRTSESCLKPARWVKDYGENPQGNGSKSTYVRDSYDSPSELREVAILKGKGTSLSNADDHIQHG